MPLRWRADPQILLSALFTGHVCHVVLGNQQPGAGRPPVLPADSLLRRHWQAHFSLQTLIAQGVMIAFCPDQIKRLRPCHVCRRSKSGRFYDWLLYSGALVRIPKTVKGWRHWHSFNWLNYGSSQPMKIRLMTTVRCQCCCWLDVFLHRQSVFCRQPCTGAGISFVLAKPLLPVFQPGFHGLPGQRGNQFGYAFAK